MEKEIQANLSQMTMYSKMGRYISNKILKYNKKSTTQRPRPSQPPLLDYVKAKKSLDSSMHSEKRSTTHRHKKVFEGPPVGYYKVSHDYVEKNTRTYNFNRSVPHFYRDKYFCNESEPALKDHPDLSTCKPYTKGLVELKRVTGRDDMKGSIRKFVEDPHQNRFKAIKMLEVSQPSVNMKKTLPRDNRMFKDYEFAPEYDYDYATNMKRLDTHILPFERVQSRDGSSLMCKTGISNCFDQNEITLGNQKCGNWKKMLPREKTGLMPSYMDKNINTRTSIGLLNLKTLEMNCSKVREMPQKIKRKGKKDQLFAEDKQNIGSPLQYSNN